MSRPSADASTRSSEPAFESIAGDPAGGLVLICDHASNRLPADYGDLGLPPSEFERHIAYDIGAAALTRLLAARLGVPAVLSCYSRLLIDLNRGEDDPTLLMRLSDGAVVPGNAAADAQERERRIARFFMPYHDAVAATIAASVATGRPPAVLSMHSFTPFWKGWPRPWQAGVLWGGDPRLALLLFDALAADPALTVGDNEPYVGGLENNTLWRHGHLAGLAHCELEVRQDLIADQAGVAAWADRLTPILEAIRREPSLARLEFHRVVRGAPLR